MTEQGPGTADELHAAIAAGEISIESLVAGYIDRIDAIDTHTRAIIAVNPRAVERARELDRGLPGLDTVPPLYGMPVIVKDNIETLELPTTAGSLALKDNRTGRDAPIVERLRAAGAIVLGKANLSEWANFRSRRSSSGWSGVGGQTRNPHDLSRSPCGSSSGSAVAVAAGFAPLAIGTETNGSVVCPAHVNGVVGFKPTVGLLSAACIVPIAHTQDTAGPMARDVAGAAQLLSAMHGSADFAATLEDARLAGKRLGVVRSATGYHEDVDALFDEALDALRAAGAVFIDELSLVPGYAEFRHDTRDVLLFEFRHDLNAYLRELPGELARLDLDGLIRFNEANAAVEMPWFRQELFIAAQTKGDLDRAEYREALARVRQATREDGIDALMAAHNLDALVAPTGGPAWVIDTVVGDRSLGSFATYPAVAGYPHVTLPMGQVHGLPVGLSFTAGHGKDADILGLARCYERERGTLYEIPAGIATL